MPRAGPDASFAGQQDTYLNILGGDAVVDAVRFRAIGAIEYLITRLKRTDEGL
mgnify:CR=1 FL=1